MKEVVHLEDVVSGFAMLSAFVVDGITTTFVGLYSDKTDTRCGKRTPWYICGTLLVLPFFLLNFLYPTIANEAL